MLINGIDWITGVLLSRDWAREQSVDPDWDCDSPRSLFGPSSLCSHQAMGLDCVVVVVVSSILFVFFLVESSGANAQITRPAVCGPTHAIILYYYLYDTPYCDFH